MVRKPTAVVLAGLLLLCACEQFQTSGKSAAGRNAALTGNDKLVADTLQSAYTAPIGQQLAWHNPDTGDSGTITAIKDGYSQQGAYCREFQQVLTTGGQAKKATTALARCRMEAGRRYLSSG